MSSRPVIGRLANRNVPTSTPLLFALDPGVSTGWAVWSLDSRRLPYLAWGQGPAEQVLDEFDDLLISIGSYAASKSKVVIETFVIPGRPQGKNVELTFPSEVIGTAKYIARRRRISEVKMQLPAERDVISLRLVKEWNWVTPNRKFVGRDAISAAKHLGSYLLQRNTVPMLPALV